MKLLLDTHIAVWAVTDDPRLGATARNLILDTTTEPVVSVVTLWEVAIKHRLGSKRGDPMPFPARYARSAFERAGYAILPVTPDHAAAVDDLPLLHGDPFDRLLVAQALAEPMRLLTRDTRLADYGALVTVA